MSAISIGRSVFTGYLKVVRLPFDAANRLLGRNGLEVDAADARVRESVGTLVGDKKLRAEGAKRQTATKQRQRAQELRKDADTREKVAAVSAKKAAANLDEVENRARLEQLEDESEVLDERSSAQTKADEAERLGDAAARVKRARKAKV